MYKRQAPSGAAALVAAAQAAGYPKPGDASILKTPSFGEMLSSPRALQAVGILFLFVLFVTMVYGPIAALLVELFPTRIRYSGMSLPYHIGNGWFGGFLPPTAFAIVLFLPETKNRDILD